jgi:hypothetical protein
MPLSYNSISGSGQQRSYNSGTTANRPANPVAGELYYDTTLGGLMVYNGSAWSTFLTPAAVLAPTIGSAVNQGTGRPYNNGQASISFTPSSELGGAAALYTVTSTPGSLTATGTSSPIVITGLSSNTAYTFTVKASNSYSNATSAATSSITATTVPDAPVLGTVTDSQSGGVVSIPINSQNTGGSAITNYAYSTDGVNYTTLSPAQSSGPITISGLTNNQAYTFRLKAINANGSSEASSVSNSVTPTTAFVLAQTFNSSGSYTIPAGTTKFAVYAIGGGQSGTQDGPGGAGGSAAGVIVNNPSVGTTYTVTVGGGGTGNAGGFGGASSFGTLINSAGTGNASGIVAGNGGGTGGAAGNTGTYNAQTPANAGSPGNAGGNVVLTNAAGFGLGLPNALTYGGGGGGGGGGNNHWQGNAKSGGAGGSPYGGAGGSGGGDYNDGGTVFTAPAAPGQAGQTGGGGGGGSGRRATGSGANSGAGGSGRVLIYTKA